MEIKTIIIIFILGVLIGATVASVTIMSKMVSLDMQVRDYLNSERNDTLFWVGVTSACVEGINSTPFLNHAVFIPATIPDFNYQKGYHAFKTNNSSMFIRPDDFFKYNYSLTMFYRRGVKG